jgi:hypothetical protein
MLLEHSFHFYKAFLYYHAYQCVASDFFCLSRLCSLPVYLTFIHEIPEEFGGNPSRELNILRLLSHPNIVKLR